VARTLHLKPNVDAQTPLSARNSADLNVPAEDALRWITSSGILVPDLSPVSEYLDQHADITGPLARACQLIRGQLPASTQLALELYRDPEIDDQYLTLYARASEYGPDFGRELDAAAEKHLDYTVGLSGRLLVATDFQRPL